MFDFVVGAKANSYLGAFGWNVVGGSTEIFIDPLSLIGEAFKSVGKFNSFRPGERVPTLREMAMGARPVMFTSAGTLQSAANVGGGVLGLGAALGKTHVNLGTVSHLVYGPLIDIQRGQHLETLGTGSRLSPSSAASSSPGWPWG